ncbi:MAG: Ubiquinone biosynthesis protein coq9, mitochondrial [Geoglossum simile]|nr:MAG: Ubiquinone biosynthesis protein coq9, mitochondrial [Geoglossum simile]
MPVTREHALRRLPFLQRCPISRSPQRRPYHSEHEPIQSPFNATEEAVLAASLRQVPAHGFTNASLSLGAREAGYLDITVNLFSRGAFDLVNYHLVTKRLALKEQLDGRTAKDDGGAIRGLGVRERVRLLVLERLMANRPIIHRWQEALAIMAQPSHVSTSIAELARLSDEIWFLAGDISVDSNWYTKRASLSMIYSSTELFMTQDKSTDFADTQEFLDRRLEDAHTVGSGISNLGKYLDFTAHSFINVLRSKGVRI